MGTPWALPGCGRAGAAVSRVGRGEVSRQFAASLAAPHPSEHVPFTPQRGEVCRRSALSRAPQLQRGPPRAPAATTPGKEGLLFFQAP